MGYGTRNNGHIKTFWPDDTDTEFYIERSATLEEIMAKCREKWPDMSRDMVSKANIRIEAECIHTDCLTYDLMDWGDWTNFLKITKEG